MVDEDVQLLVLGACEYVLLHGKREFEDMIKVEMGEIILDYPVNPISSQEFLNMEEGGIGCGPCPANKATKAVLQMKEGGKFIS